MLIRLSVRFYLWVSVAGIKIVGNAVFSLTDSPAFISSRFVDRFTALFLPAKVFQHVFAQRQNNRLGRQLTFPCYVQNVLLDQNFLRW